MLQSRPAPRLQALTVEKSERDEEFAAESDDEVGDDEDAKGKGGVLRLREEVPEATLHYPRVEFGDAKKQRLHPFFL